MLKKPSWLENRWDEVGLYGRARDVCLATSKAMASPVAVIRRARSLKSVGIVSIGVFVGSIVVDKINPARMLPRVRRVIEFIRAGLFSFVGARGWVRGGLICT